MITQFSAWDTQSSFWGNSHTDLLHILFARMHNPFSLNLNISKETMELTSSNALEYLEIFFSLSTVTLSRTRPEGNSHMKNAWPCLFRYEKFLISELDSWVAMYRLFKSLLLMQVHIMGCKIIASTRCVLHCMSSGEFFRMISDIYTDIKLSNCVRKKKKSMNKLHVW